MKRRKFVLTKRTAFLYKFCIVVGMMHLIAPFIIPFIFRDTDPELLAGIWMLSLTLFGTVVLIYPFIFEDPKNIMTPKVKADKYTVKAKSFEDFLNLSETAIKNFEYSKIEHKILEGYEIYLYARPRKKSNLELIQIIRADELTNNILNDSNERYVECVEANYEECVDELSERISIMTVVCVNRINSVFKTLLNSNIEQDFRLGRFIVGVSFGGKGLYVSKQKGGFAITRYKRYRKKFFEIFDFLLES